MTGKTPTCFADRVRRESRGRSPSLFRPWIPAFWLAFGMALSAAVPCGGESAEAVWTRWIGEAEARLARVDSYTAVFHKQERIDGRLREEETVFMKFKRPFKIYMKWIRPPHEGRELLHVAGWNGNRIRIHGGGGLLGLITMNLDPHGRAVMRANRHVITESGLEHLVGVVAANIRKGVATGEVRFVDLGRDNVYGRDARTVELRFPADRAKGYYCCRAVLSLDAENRMPLRILVFDADDRLVERYEYEDVRLDAGLTDADFAPENPAYRLE